MRTAKIRIDGTEYVLCFSGRTMRACTQRYGDVSKIAEALDTKDTVKALDETIWLLSALMDAGARYCRLNGVECPDPLSYDELYDRVDIPDMSSLRYKVMETINAGKEATVVARPGKNTEATLVEAPAP